MEVILIEDVLELGKRGDIVKVAGGYGRNYLIPKHLAIPATSGNVKMIEQQRTAMAKKETKHREEAELLAAELSQLHLIISRKAGETGVLFGSVTTKDIEEVIKSSGIHLDRRRILLAQPIKTIGTSAIETRPHNDVEARVLVSVFPEGEEPVARALRRGEESDKIIKELEEKVREIRQLTGQVTAQELEAGTEHEEKKSAKPAKAGSSHTQKAGGEESTFQRKPPENPQGWPET